MQKSGQIMLAIGLTIIGQVELPAQAVRVDSISGRNSWAKEVAQSIPVPSLWNTLQENISTLPGSPVSEFNSILRADSQIRPLLEFQNLGLRKSAQSQLWNLDDKTSVLIAWRKDRIYIIQFELIEWRQPMFGGMRGSVRLGGGLNNDDIYTYAQRRADEEYWSVIKENLNRFIGMSKVEVCALLGPERCSSKTKDRLTYRVGMIRLDFLLTKEKVVKFIFTDDAYIPGT